SPHEIGSGRPRVVPQGVRVGIRARPSLFLQAEANAQLSVREGAALPALSRRACAAPLSERRGALHRLQAVRGDLSGASHHHRGGAAPPPRPTPHPAPPPPPGPNHLIRRLPRHPPRRPPP